ncbi:hypothetical protein WMY93_026506 [Mugilogobius chulae]|uniref:Apolipoprotein C-I n=1 Tax=Mugilogobius chulae TaxID=88201 RepID=A0AAW0N3E1_9GOBI
MVFESAPSNLVLYKEGLRQTAKHSWISSALTVKQKNTANMKLYLAIAVLVLAFVAYTEAQEVTMEERFSQLGQQMTEFGKTVADKARTAAEEFNNNEHVQKAKTWLQEKFEKFTSNFN